jgi:hypothetical protein
LPATGNTLATNIPPTCRQQKGKSDTRKQQTYANQGQQRAGTRPRQRRR